MAKSKARPKGITLLSLFFLIGATASFVSFVSLIFPGSFLEPMWRLNPRARAGFDDMGPLALVLMFAVCVSCATTAVGLWRGARWGYRMALALLATHMMADILNVVLGTEPKAVFAIPIVMAVFAYLMSGRVRSYFNSTAAISAGVKDTS